jgi:hypothetical protein
MTVSVMKAKWRRSIVRLAGIALAGAFSSSAALGQPAEGEPPLVFSHESPEYPHVQLSIDPSPGPHRWILRVQNVDSIPLRIVADPHLLSLDVTPPGRSKAQLHCTLPIEMRPSTDERNVVVVPPEKSYIDAFDPRLYCWGVLEDRALKPGAEVIARFGFARPRGKDAPPYVVASMHRERSPNPEILSDAFEIPTPPEEPERPPSEARAPERDDGPEPGLWVSAPARIDVSALHDLSLPITVTNATPRTLRFMLRPETVVIDVTGPEGTLRCQSPIHPTAIAELFTTLAPRARTTTYVLVSSLCRPEIFSAAGLYSLRTSIDTRRASGAKIGILAFTGRSVVSSTTLVRLREARVAEEL